MKSTVPNTGSVSGRPEGYSEPSATVDSLNTTLWSATDPAEKHEAKAPPGATNRVCVARRAAPIESLRTSWRSMACCGSRPGKTHKCTGSAGGGSDSGKLYSFH